MKRIIQICLLSILILSRANTLDLEDELSRFLTYLEKDTFDLNDVVFLLESSGYVETSGFTQMKSLAWTIVQRFLTVSEHQDRVAVVSFSAEAVTDVNYIGDGRGQNMCTLRKGIQDIDYQGEYRFTFLAMEQARDILREARLDTRKIVVLLTNGLGMRGPKSFMLADELKSEGVVIYVIGFENASEKLKEMATSTDHSLMVSEFDEVPDIIERMTPTGFPSNTFGHFEESCDSISCDKNAKCICDARTGNFKCICKAGYFKSSNGFECLKCPRGFIKSTSATHDLYCQGCLPHATTLEEGSINSDDCLCEAGFEKSAGSCSKCPKGTYKDQIRNTKCLKCPPFSYTLGEGSRSISNCTCEFGYDGENCLRQAPPQQINTLERNSVSSFNVTDVTSKDNGAVTELPDQSPRKDSDCAKIDYNALDEVDSSLPLFSKLIKSLPRNKRMPKIMELLNNVYSSVEKQ